jgi:hypothetical protein
MTHTIAQIRAGDLAGIRRLELRDGLTAFPPEIYDLADSLEILDLSGNALSSLPDDLPRLRKLKIIFCSYNAFVDLPEVLGQCHSLSMVGFKANRIRTVSPAALPPKLRWLTLTDNQIEALPAEIGNCAELQKLMLAGNALRELPQALAACRKLELLRIAANRLTELPSWLLAMPRLSWLAYAGNPFCEAVEAQRLKAAFANSIHWRDLDVQQVIGEGASGVIYRAGYTGEDGHRDVAVKVFKGAVTSDGLPDLEMAACLSAGSHPNLIPVLGQVADHPDGRHALVMGLIDSAFGNLAGPPSLESCTRDIYAMDARYDLTVVLRIMGGMASLSRHLHAQGLMHGDLYAHNILHDGHGKAVLGDFGAACVYPNDDAVPGEALQRLEVRAFGCLLEDLLERCEAQAADKAIVEALWTLTKACLSEDVSQRPLFSDIERTLSSLSA